MEDKCSRPKRRKKTLEKPSAVGGRVNFPADAQTHDHQVVKHGRVLPLKNGKLLYSLRLTNVENTLHCTYKSSLKSKKHEERR